MSSAPSSIPDAPVADDPRRPESRRARAAGGPSARERIFAAAARLFYERGIRAVGVETIAAEANTTKMTLYRSFPSKDALVAEYLREQDAAFWRYFEELARRHPDDPRGLLRAYFRDLQAHAADPHSRGCPLANAAVELTEPDHPARPVIRTHKAKLRERFAELAAAIGARKPQQLADQLFLLAEGAQASLHSLGHSGPAGSASQAAEALIEAHLARRR